MNVFNSQGKENCPLLVHCITTLLVVLGASFYIKLFVFQFIVSSTIDLNEFCCVFFLSFLSMGILNKEDNLQMNLLATFCP